MNKEVLGQHETLPLSTAVRCGEFIFLSGKVGTGDIEAGTREVLETMKSRLESAGSSLKKVVKTTVFLAHVRDFEAMNRVYREYFPSEPPSRTTVGVTLIRQNTSIEIEAVAIA